MENNNNQDYVVFLDLEANQAMSGDFTLHEILQIGLIKYNLKTKKLVMESIYCKPIYKINDKIKYLLGKRLINKCFKIGIDKKTALLKLKEFTQDYPIYVFGNYDKIVINFSLDKFKLDLKFNIIDFLETNKSIFKINNIFPSLSTISKVCNITQKNSHNALNDAFILFKIYKKIMKMDLNDFRTKICKELLRPKTQNNIDFRKYSNICSPNLTKECTFIFDHSLFEYTRETIEFNNKVETKIVGYHFKANINIYNHDANVIKTINENIYFDNNDDFKTAVCEFYTKNVCHLLDNCIILGGHGAQYLLTGSFICFDKTIAYYHVSNEKIKAYKKFNNLIELDDLYFINLIKNDFLDNLIQINK